jgi:hypothetical protein
MISESYQADFEGLSEWPQGVSTELFWWRAQKYYEMS